MFVFLICLIEAYILYEICIRYQNIVNQIEEDEEFINAFSNANWELFSFQNR